MKDANKWCFTVKASKVPGWCYVVFARIGSGGNTHDDDFAMQKKALGEGCMQEMENTWTCPLPLPDLEKMGFVKDHPDALEQLQALQADDDEEEGETFFGGLDESLAETVKELGGEPQNLSSAIGNDIKDMLKNAPALGGVQPQDIGFTTRHSTTGKTFVAFSPVAKPRELNDEEKTLVVKHINGKMVVENVYICDPKTVEVLESAGFVKDNANAQTILEFVEDHCVQYDSNHDPDPTPTSDEDPFAALKKLSDGPAAPDKPVVPPSLTSMLVDSTGHEQMRCPKCGGTVFIDPKANIGSITPGLQQNSVYKICAHCLEQVVDPELVALFGVNDESDDPRRKFFNKEDFVAIDPDGVKGDYRTVIPNYFATRFATNAKLDPSSLVGGSCKVLELQDNGVVAAQIDIPDHKYVTEDGTLVAEWAGTKRFLAVGTLERKDGDQVFNITFIGEEKPLDEQEAKFTVTRPNPLKFSNIRIRTTNLSNGAVEVENNAIIRTARLVGFVSIDLNNCISEQASMTPGAEPWFLVECTLFSGEPTLIVTDGDIYYRVRETESGKKEIYATKDLEIGFGADDHEMIETLARDVIARFGDPKGHKTDEDSWYND